jgi:hypothetical protein
MGGLASSSLTHSSFWLHFQNWIYFLKGTPSIRRNSMPSKENLDQVLQMVSEAFQWLGFIFDYLDTLWRDTPGVVHKKGDQIGRLFWNLCNIFFEIYF